MNHFYVIVIPSTIYNVPAPLAIVEDLRVAVKSAFAQAFGGYTETQATGGYKAESGELIEERVYLVQAAYEVEDDELVENLALRVKEELHQESVMVHKDHEVRFY
jgi:chemotaxis response regulator CheB